MASHPIPAEHDATAHAHPTEMTYIKIALFLAIVTVIEVTIYYIEGLSSILVPALVALSALKFVFVVGYFMHLKFDSKLLGGIFGSALIVSLAVFVGAWFVTHYDQVTQFVGYLTAR
jgi:cytochrome c oxidase subunit IV